MKRLPDRLHRAWAALLPLLAACGGTDPRAELAAWREQQVAEARPPPRAFVPPSDCLAQAGGCFTPTPPARLPPFDPRRLDAAPPR